MATTDFYQHIYYIKVTQLLQRDHVAGWVSFGQKWKTGTARQYFADIIGLSSNTSPLPNDFLKAPTL